MKALDRLIRRWRIAKALRYVRPGDRLLDIGCFDDRLLRRMRGRIAHGVGIDPLATPRCDGTLEIRRGVFPDDCVLADGEFDCITLLAVLEHIPDRHRLARACFRVLAPGGRLIVTVPRPTVDYILHLLRACRLIDGMSLEQHNGFDARLTPSFFTPAGFRLHCARRFQLGLNCLFVFSKPP